MRRLDTRLAIGRCRSSLQSGAAVFQTQTRSASIRLFTTTPRYFADDDAPRSSPPANRNGASSKAVDARSLAASRQPPSGVISVRSLPRRGARGGPAGARGGPTSLGRSNVFERRTSPSQGGERSAGARSFPPRDPTSRPGFSPPGAGSRGRGGTFAARSPGRGRGDGAARRGGRGARGGRTGGGRGGREGRQRETNEERDQRLKKEDEERNYVDPEITVHIKRQSQGVETIYTPSLTLESLAATGPAVASRTPFSKASLAVRGMLIMANGSPSVKNDNKRDKKTLMGEIRQTGVVQFADEDAKFVDFKTMQHASEKNFEENRREREMKKLEAKIDAELKDDPDASNKRAKWTEEKMKAEIEERLAAQDKTHAKRWLTGRAAPLRNAFGQIPMRGETQRMPTYADDTMGIIASYTARNETAQIRDQETLAAKVASLVSRPASSRARPAKTAG